VEEKPNRFHFFCGTLRFTVGKKICKITSLKLHEVMVIQLLLYVYETWTLQADQIKRIEAAEV